MMGGRMEFVVYSLSLLLLVSPIHSTIPHESCSLEWCGERELRLPSQLLVDSCKLAEEVYKLEVLNKKLDYLQAACLDSRSSEKSCWTGSACSCNDCSSLVDCCISSQKCTTRVLRSPIGISYQRALSFLNGAITKCRLNTQKALMTGMTKEDADVGVLILEEIRLFNQYSPRAVLGNKTKAMIKERIRKDMRPVIFGDTVKGDGKPLIVFSRKARDLLRLLELVDGRPLSAQKELTSMVDGETGKDSTWIYRKETEEEGKAVQVYPSLPTPIVSPQSIPETTTTVIPMESATTVVPTRVVIPVSTMETIREDSMETFPTPPSISTDSLSPPSTDTLDTSTFLNLTPSIGPSVRRKYRPFDHLKGKLDKRVKLIDMRKIGRRKEGVRRDPSRGRLSKEEKEILASIDVKEMEKMHTKFPYEITSEWEEKKGRNPLEDHLLSLPTISLTHTPLEDDKKDEFSLKRIAQFKVLPSPSTSPLDTMRRELNRSEIRRSPPRLQTIKEIERLDKEEEGKRTHHIRKPKMIVIRTRVEDESALLPLHSSSLFTPSTPVPSRVVVPHAVAPPRRDRPLPIQRDSLTGRNNCTAGIDWCVALSMCLIEATSSHRHPLNQMSHCQQNSFLLAQTVAVEYGKCLMNESCDLFDRECKYPSSLPLISHCPSFFHQCQQLAVCCPLTHRCSRLTSSSPSAFSLDASCLICGQ